MHAELPQGRYLRAPQRAIGVWLLLCFFLLLGLVFIGGLTRLTGSGLSIVEWRPLSGVVPPLNGEDWQREFDAYRAYPEYRLVNAGMSLEAFKRIFWFEFIHRLWGRFIGVALLLPLLYFALKRQVDRWLVLRIGALLLLGGAQGAVGWYMVKSGLDQIPAVSAIRLTLHLCMALLLCALLFWVALDELRGTQPKSRKRPGLGALWTLLVFAIITVASGGLVAGTHAGRNYNTFPLMAGKLVPDGLLSLNPWWRNLYESVLTVQFQHRILALTLALAALVVGLRILWRQVRKHDAPSLAATSLIIMALLQPLLGVLTLLGRVPISLAVAHQMGGFLLVASVLWVAHEQRHPQCSK